MSHPITVSLSNFRKHTQLSLTFPAKGLIRLAGKNGQGKSTIFNALMYALYGKVKKPYTRGSKKGCTVIVDAFGMRITRSPKPKRLLVEYQGSTYEGDGAEGLIHTIMGMDHGEFMVSSYIVQLEKNRVSILSLSPAEQLKVIQTLAFGDSRNIEVRSQVKALIKQSLEEKIKLEGQLALLTAQHREKEDNLGDEVAVECGDEVDVDVLTAQTNEYMELANALSDKLQTLNTSLERLREQEKLFKTTHEKSNRLALELEALEKEKKKLASTINGVNLNTLLEEKSAQLKVARDVQAYLERLTTFETLKQDFDNEVKIKLEELSSVVKTDEEIEEMTNIQTLLENQMSDYAILKKNVEMLAEKKREAKILISNIFREMIKEGYTLPSKKPKDVINLLETSLVNAKKRVESVNPTKKKFKCPGCSLHLALTHENTLVEYGDLENTETTKEEYEAMKDTVTDIEMWLTVLKRESVNLNVNVPELPQDPREELASQRKEVARATKNKNEYDELLTRTFPSSLTKLSASLEKSRRDLPPGDTIALKKIARSEASLAKEVSTLAATIEETLKKKKELARVEKELTEKKKLVESVKSSSLEEVTKKIKVHEAKVSQLIAQSSEYNTKIKEGIELCEKIRCRETWVASKKEVDALKDEIDVYQASLSTVNDELEGAYGLEEACKQAELLAIQRTVDNINEHARTYLDEFFDEPISVNLQCGDSKVGVSIEYHGETFADIEEELSGGERQRCELAFILGINDMVQSKVLLLDECLNNIDGEASSDILSLLRDYAVEKPVIVISHDCVDGMFDKVVTIDDGE